MDFIHDFDSDASYVLEACESKVLSYPESVKPLGYKYLEKLHLLKGEKHGGFCYLMPFWLMDAFKAERDICRVIALGNVFGLLYFMSQDDVMDNSGRESSVKPLPLSTLFFTDFFSLYRTIFPGTSLFWNYFNRFIAEWAESVVWEQENHWGKAEEYFEDDFILLSRKAAPMKIPFAAMCILSGKDSEIESFSEFVDYDQIVYQMIDDWRDWKEDLARGSYTYLLVQCMKYSGLKESSHLEASHVKRAIYVGNVGESIFQMAKGYNSLSKDCIAHMELPYLNAYTALEESLCDKITSTIRKEKEVMLKGGLDSLLWNMKNHA